MICSILCTTDYQSCTLTVNLHTASRLNCFFGLVSFFSKEGAQQGKLNWFILSSLRSNKPQILPYFQVHHPVMATSGCPETNVACRCTTTNLSHPTISKSFWVHVRWCQSRIHKLCYSKVWLINNKQKMEIFPPRPRAKSQLHQTWHGDTGGRYHLWFHCYRELEIWGGNAPLRLKP